jgi:iron complex outermembrane receptor protein
LTQNIYAPNWNAFIPPYNNSGSTFEFQNDAAFFAQDQIEMPGHLFGLAGFRYDSLTINNTGYSQAASTCNEAVTPRFGLLWNPIKPLSAYASYTANFGASALGAITTNGTALPPQSAQQWEFGLKQETDNKKFTATESIYQLTKENVPQADPANPQFAEAVGQIRSKGVEVQVAGEILTGWKVIAAYSYINAAVTEGSSAGTYGEGSQVGQRPTGIPYNSGSVWSTYEVQQGPFKKVRLGAGVVYRSQEVTYVPNSTGSGYAMEQIPGFATVNLMAAYPFQIGPTKWTAQVNVENLFDSYYFTSISPYQAMPGAPVNFMASLKAEF